MKKRNFSVIKHDEVNNDLQEIVDYYNEQKHKLGNEFYSVALKQMKRLKNDFLLYEVKYENVRCVSVIGFPYMIHYTVNEENKTVLINAIIGMSQDPNTNWGKRK
jgi:hypothetical protein